MPQSSAIISDIATSSEYQLFFQLQMQALAKRPTTGSFNAAPKLGLHSCAKTLNVDIAAWEKQVATDSCKSVKWRTRQWLIWAIIISIQQSSWLLSIILTIRYHPRCCREMHYNCCKRTISEFASTNYFSDLYFLRVTTWLTLLSLSTAIEPLVRRNLARGCKFKQRHIYNQTAR